MVREMYNVVQGTRYIGYKVHRTRTYIQGSTIVPMEEFRNSSILYLVRVFAAQLHRGSPGFRPEVFQVALLCYCNNLPGRPIDHRSIASSSSTLQVHSS